MFRYMLVLLSHANNLPIGPKCTLNFVIVQLYIHNKFVEDCRQLIILFLTKCNDYGTYIATLATI